MKQLSGQDALFLHMDVSNAASHGTMIYLYDQTTVRGGPLRFEQIVAHIEHHLDISEFLRRRIVQVPFSLDYPYWVPDEHFDITFHVRHVTLRKPGNWRQFCAQAADIHARPLDLSRPPWEMHVVEGLDHIAGLPKGSFAILTKVHHAAVDGSAFAELTWALHDAEIGTGRRVPILGKAGKGKIQPLEAAPGTVELLSRALMANLTAPLRLAGPAFKVLPKLGMTVLKKVGGALTNQRQRVPKTRFNGVVSGSRVFDSVVLELQTFKDIKAAVDGATVNDVVLAVVGGALRRYLQSHKALPKESLVTLSPVNTRPDKGGGGGSGNSISFVTFPLRTDIADPIERLRAVCADTSQTKEMNQAVGARELTDLTRFAPPATLAFVGRLASIAGLGGAGPAPLHNTGISNVPGPRVPLYLQGARLTYLSCVMPIATGMGLTHAVSSYDGRMIISPTSTPEMLPDAPFYATCIRDSVRQMHKAALTHAKTVAAATARGSTVKTRRTVRRASRPATRARATTKP